MEYVEAILEALGNEKFRQFVVEHMNEDNSDPLQFCVDRVVYHLERKDGKWRIGNLTGKDVWWWKVVKGEALIISV